MLDHRIEVDSPAPFILSQAACHSLLQPQFEDVNRYEIEKLFSVFMERDQRARFLLTTEHELYIANAKAREMIEAGQISFDARGHLRFVSPRAQLSVNEVLLAANKTVNRYHYKIIRVMDSEWCCIQARMLECPTPYIELSIQHACDTTVNDLTPLTEAFGLTLTEGKVLRGITQARCPKAIAIDNEISVHTVRAHIRSIFAKMGTHSAATTLSLVHALTS